MCGGCGGRHEAGALTAITLHRRLPKLARGFALKQTLEQIQMFEESAPIVPISRSGRSDVRQAVFGEGYRLIHIILPEHLLILSLLPPGSFERKELLELLEKTKG